MCSSCDSSLYFETTYSQDERIDAALKLDKIQRHRDEQIEETERHHAFQDINNLRQEFIFQIQGLNILKFTSTKIKFSFEPYKVVKYVSKKAIFYCSLIYLPKYRAWKLKRDSFPGNYKWSIYSMFYSDCFFAIDDSSVMGTIVHIYKKLMVWAQQENELRQKKFSRYLRDEDVYLDEDDEEIFLTDIQRAELHRKRWSILKRMIPPTATKVTRKRRALRC